MRALFLLFTIYVSIALSSVIENRPLNQNGRALRRGQAEQSALPQRYQENFADRQTLFEKKLELTADNWFTSGRWHLSQSSDFADMGGASIASFQGIIQQDANDRLVTTIVDLPPLADLHNRLTLKFNEAYKIDSGCDTALVEISPDAGLHWITLDARTGISDWCNTIIDLTSYAGQRVNLGFRFRSSQPVMQEYWNLSEISLVRTALDPLRINLSSLTAQKFPFVFMNVTVDTNAAGISTLNASNFRVFEDGIRQTDYFEVTPPKVSGGSRMADIVFVLDVTGSMGSEIEAVRQNMASFVAALSKSEINYSIGFVVFGDIVYTYNSGNLYFGYEQIKSIINAIKLEEHGIGSGGDTPENQLQGLLAASQMTFRPGANRVLILLTDAPAHESDSVTSLTVAALTDRLVSANVNVFPIFDTASSNSRSQYIPIAQRFNSTGRYFHIYDNFNDIILEIGNVVASNYLLRYRTANAVMDGKKRTVRIAVQHKSDEAFCEGTYTPGSMPRVQRTSGTMALHDRSWAEGTALDLAVEVTDEVAPFVATVTLYYKNTASTVYKSKAMTKLAGKVWQTQVSSADVARPGLDYYVVATDGENAASDPSIDPANNPYQLAVLPNVAPKISHTPVITLTVGLPIPIRCAIVDNTNMLKGSRLYYRKTGQLLFQATDLVRSTGDNFQAEIPATMATSDGVDYYLQAWDDFNVSGYSGTPDLPWQVKTDDDLSSYLDKKLAIITSISGVQRPVLGKGAFFVQEENRALALTSQTKLKHTTSAATAKELEAVARLYLSEMATQEAINGAIPISAYGAKGLRSLATSLVISKVFKLFGEKCAKIPLIGKQVDKAMNSASGFFESGWRKLMHIYITNQVPPPGIPYQTTLFEYGEWKDKALSKAFEKVTKKSTELADDFVASRTGDESIFDKADRYIQEYIFLEPFELAAAAKQREAVERSESLDFKLDFRSCEQNATKTVQSMAAWNSAVNAGEKYVNTTREFLSWVTFGAAIVVIAVSILAAIPTGGLSLLGTIAALAGMLVTYGTLVEKSLAVTEAAAAGVYVDGVLPFGFMQTTVNQAYGLSAATALRKAARAPLTATSSHSCLLSESLEKEINLVRKINEKLNAGNFAFLDSPEEFYASEKQTQKYENYVSAIYVAVQDTANALDADFRASVNQLNVKMAARYTMLSSLELYILCWRNGLRTDEISGGVKNVMSLCETYLADEINLDNNLKSFIDTARLTVPAVIGVHDVKSYRAAGDDQRILVKAEINNYTDASPISNIQVILSTSSVVWGDSIRTLNLTACESKFVEFEVKRDGDQEITGMIYTANRDSVSAVKHMEAYLFSFSPEKISPTTGNKLDNSGIFCYPNPFNPAKETTTLRYSLRKEARVSIKIYDAANVQVRSLLTEVYQTATEQEQVWDGRDDSGAVVANGVYFYVIKSSAGEQAVGKVAVLR